MRSAAKVPFPVCCAILCLLLGVGCSGDTKKDKDKKEDKGSYKKDGPKGDSDRATLGTDWGEEKSAAKPTDKARPESPRDSDKTMESRAAKSEEARVGGVKPMGGKKGPKSGILTAGSFDDTLEPEHYRAFLKKVGQDGAVRGLPGQFLGQRLVLTVEDAAGKPVGNARVHITSSAGGPAVELVTHSDGRVVFLPTWDQVAADADFSLSVTPPGGGNPVRVAVDRKATRHTVRLAGVQVVLPERLDLALVVDTTGSMGDELEYLKSELRSIVRTVHDRFPQVDVRVGLVFYRDKGDEYVTRPFDFTADIGAVRKNLQAQSAAGGGDTPEAMERGLEEAGRLSWRDGNTARVLFLIADAPPHAEDMTRAMKAIDGLRKKGVVFYPVAGSGYDNATEFIMRTAALLSGGVFLFLTDDSGVGNAHAEPHLTNYHVERLDRLMIRLIAGELTGKRVPPAPNDIVRTVGKPQ
jgi:hypothetical protein